MRDLGVRELDPGLCVRKGVGLGSRWSLSHHGRGAKRRRLKDRRRISKNSPQKGEEQTGLGVSVAIGTWKGYGNIHHQNQNRPRGTSNSETLTGRHRPPKGHIGTSQNGHAYLEKALIPQYSTLSLYFGKSFLKTIVFFPSLPFFLFFFF